MSAGLWREVRLEIIKPTRLKQVEAVNDTREDKPGRVIVRDGDSGKTLFSSPLVIPVNVKAGSLR